jgi:hypothetical protein
MIEYNKINKINTELQCIKYLTNLINEKFYVKKLFDGCKADLAIKCKTIDNDEWLGIQIKSTSRRVKNNISEAYKFDLRKDYENYIIICICLEDKNVWIFENKIVSNIKSTLTIGIKSKYNKFKTNDSNIEQILENYYFNFNKFTFKELDTPQSPNVKIEYEYRKIREQKIDFLNFQNNEMEGLVYDFKVGDKKIQEKVGGHNHKNGKSYSFCLTKMNGRVNGKKKRQCYSIGDNDYYWLNCRNSSLFYIIPEKNLIEKGFIGNNDGKLKQIIISNTNKNTFWTKEYLFDYDNLDKEKLCKILL